MDGQKLDSLLEEHFKLRGYMRTVQLRKEISAYNEAQVKVQQSRHLYQAQVTPTAISRAEGRRAEVSERTTVISRHPIVCELPMIHQATIKLQPTRGRAVTVDMDSHVVATGAQGDEPAGPAMSSVNSHKPTRPGGSGGVAALHSVWRRDESADHSSDDSDERRSLSSDEGEGQPPAKSAPSGGSEARTSDARRVIGANGVNDGSIAADASESDDSRWSDTEDHELLRTGIISGNVMNKAQGFASLSASPSPVLLSGAATDGGGLKASSETKAHGYGADTGASGTAVTAASDSSNEEDLLDFYRKTFNVDDESDDEDADERVYGQANGHQQPPSLAKRNKPKRKSRPASQPEKSREALAEAIWENQEQITADSFSALISLWKRIGNGGRGGEGTRKTQPTGRQLWQEAKSKVLQEKQDGATTTEKHNSNHQSTGTSDLPESRVSSEMQTSLKTNHDSSAQTDGQTDGKRSVDAETLVDEFLRDKDEEKSVGKLDRKLARKLSRRGLAEGEIAALLDKHRTDVSQLKKQRQQERMRSLQLLEETRRNKMAATALDDQVSDGEERSDATDDEMEKIEADMVGKILKKCDGQASEQDLQKILRRARRQQEELLRQRNVERVKQNERLQQKLLSRRTARRSEEAEKGEHESALDTKNREFFAKLQSQLLSGKLTNKEFNQLLEEHLHSIQHAEAADKQQHRQQSDQASVDFTAEASHVVNRGKAVDKTLLENKQNNRAKALARIEKQKRNKRRQQEEMM